MIKVLTALQNEEINYELKKIKEFCIEYDDIQYEEGLIEILKDTKNIQYLIFNNKILEQNSLQNMIDTILNINKYIKLIFLYNNKEEINNLNNNTKQIIKIIKYNFKDNNEIIKNIKNEICNEYNSNNYYLEENERMKKEINNLKNIIEKNNINLKKISNTKNKEKVGKIISITGARNSGKTIITSIISKILSKNKKVLIIDMDFENKDISLLFLLEKYNIEKDKNILKKIDNNLDAVCDMDIIFSKINNIEDNLNKLFIKLKNKYDYIFIDLSENINTNIYNYFLNISNYIFLLVEGNIINVKRSEIIYEKLSKINSNIKVILNKMTNYSIDKLIINKFFNDSYLGTINYDKNFENIINSNFKTKIKNCDIKNIINKI